MLRHHRQRSLELPRNGPGTRPLYVLDRGDGLVAFASLLPLLVAMHLQRHTVNPTVMAQLATGNFAHGAATQFSGIERIMPGETLSLTPNGRQRHVHWHLEARDPIPASAPRTEIMAELCAKIEASVRRAAPGDGPPALENGEVAGDPVILVAGALHLGFFGGADVLSARAAGAEAAARRRVDR